MTPRKTWKKPVTRFLMRTLGRVLNRDSTPFLLSYKPDFHNHFDTFADFQDLAKKWTQGNYINNSGDFERMYLIYQNAKYVLDSGVEGDLVELGVYKGNSAAILAVLARQYNRKLILFDTFTGFDERDYIDKDDETYGCDFSDTSVEDVRDLIGSESTIFVKGFFPNSINTFDMPDKIAVAHIDCDLGEPMKAGLSEFYKRLPAGGMLILHDYSSGWWQALHKAVDEFFDDKPEKPVLMPDKSGTAIVRKAATLSP